MLYAQQCAHDVEVQDANEFIDLLQMVRGEATTPARVSDQPMEAATKLDGRTDQAGDILLHRDIRDNRHHLASRGPDATGRGFEAALGPTADRDSSTYFSCLLGTRFPYTGAAASDDDRMTSERSMHRCVSPLLVGRGASRGKSPIGVALVVVTSDQDLENTVTDHTGHLELHQLVNGYGV